MMRDQAVAIIKEQMVFRTDLDATIIGYLQLAQTTLESEPTKPWFLISENSERRTFIGDQRLPLPTDFLQEVEEAVLRYVPDDADEPSDEVDLIKDDYDTLRETYKDTATGPPKAYALVGNYFYLFPKPDDDYLIKMIYYRTDALLTTNIENGWLKWAPLFIMGKAGDFVTGGPIRDLGARKVFQEWENKGRMLLFSQNEARQHTNRLYQMGGPHV